MKPSKLMGFDVPGDQKVPVPVRDWNAMKLALWRSKAAWDIAKRAAGDILGECKHVGGCSGEQIETEPCLPDCPDREMRMSALVVLNAARMFAPVDANRPADQPYFAPSREYFSEVMAALGSAQIEIATLHATMQMAGVQIPTAPPYMESQLPEQSRPTQPAPPLLEEPHT